VAHSRLMSTKLSPRLGVAVLLLIAVVFGANHVAARVAIDHGASVSAAVAVRSGCTALALLFLLINVWQIPPVLERRMLVRALFVGCLVAMQSYSLYSAVALIPVALALLVFQTCPLLFMLISWATGKEKLRQRSLVAMPAALAGLALALDVRIEGFEGRWAEIGAGVLWALAASVSFALVLFFNAHWLKALDGRTRTFFMMAVTAVLVLTGGGAAGTLALPADATGWLGLALLTLLYGTAITSLFIVLPRLSGGAASTVALNFEPIAVLGIAWVALGQAVAPLQIVGAFIVVGAIAWLGAAKH
jgi:drug/metabolite transporter (DMT)-like permease